MENEEKASVEDIDAPAGFEEFITNDKGIKAMPAASFRNFQGPFHQQETYNFLKWIRVNKPEVSVSIEDAPIADLRSEVFRMSMVFLAQDILLPVYLNLVANYIYDRTRGALKHDKKTVHLTAVYKDEKKGKVKKFFYEGPVEGLEKCGLDLDSFMDN